MSAKPTATPSPTAVPTTVACLLPSKPHEIYVSDYANPPTTPSFVQAFSGTLASGTNNVAPIGQISGAATTLDGPYGIALDASGNIYVANQLENSVTVYPPNPSGTLNEAPIATIAGSNTGLDDPYGIAVDAAGRIYVSNSMASPPTITVYAANPSGTLNEEPVATITGSNTGLAVPLGIALDAAGDIFVANEGVQGASHVASVTEYVKNPVGTLNESPLVTIEGTTTTLSNPNDVAVDSSGRIYVSDPSGAGPGGSIGAIDVFAAGLNGTVDPAPLARIAGASTAVTNVSGVALDSAANIYAVVGESVAVYGANPSGTIDGQPCSLIFGSSTNFYDAFGIAIH